MRRAKSLQAKELRVFVDMNSRTRLVIFVETGWYLGDTPARAALAQVSSPMPHDSFRSAIWRFPLAVRGQIETKSLPEYCSCVLPGRARSPVQRDHATAVHARCSPSPLLLDPFPLPGLLLLPLLILLPLLQPHLQLMLIRQCLDLLRKLLIPPLRFLSCP